MDRRDSLVKISWGLKAIFLTPAYLSILESCKNETSNSTGSLVLNKQQNELVRTIADTIIPRTTTASASDVGVDKLIDLLLMDVFEEPDKQLFVNGLTEFDRTCETSTGSSFVGLEESKRLTYLEKVDKETLEKESEDRKPFYLTFKDLTVTIYFATEKGVKQNLNYTPVPGPYIGDVEYKTGDKIVIGNSL